MLALNENMKSLINLRSKSIYKRYSVAYTGDLPGE
jgi:hypothetical protein